jgi:hypothetical protein
MECVQESEGRESSMAENRCVSDFNEGIECAVKVSFVVCIYLVR